MLLVKKKDGSLRLCVDYQHINKVTIKKNYLFPRTDNLLDQLVGACVFNKVDLHLGYHQIHVNQKIFLETTF